MRLDKDRDAGTIYLSKTYLTDTFGIISFRKYRDIKAITVKISPKTTMTQMTATPIFIKSGKNHDRAVTRTKTAAQIMPNKIQPDTVARKSRVLIP